MNTAIITFWQILIPIVGLFIGSFANVLIYRIPRREEWVRTPSHCPVCGSRLRPIDMIPVLSWLALRGRCHSCKSRISLLYPLIELSNGFLWLICLAVWGLSPFLPIALTVSTTLLVVAVIDWKTSEIPNGLNFFLFIVGIIWNFYTIYAGYHLWLPNILGFFSVALLLSFIAVVSGGGMGGGDIKLMAVCGLILGWQKILLALGLASIIGTLIMLPIYLIQKRDQKIPFAFGPFLALGIFIAMCFGDKLLALLIGL